MTRTACEWSPAHATIQRLRLAAAARTPDEARSWLTRPGRWRRVLWRLEAWGLIPDP